MAIMDGWRGIPWARERFSKEMWRMFEGEVIDRAVGVEGAGDVHPVESGAGSCFS